MILSCQSENCSEKVFSKNFCKYHYNQLYYLKNKDKILSQKKIYNSNNLDHKKEYDKIYRKNNKESILNKKYTYYNNKIKTDPSFKIRMSVSRSIGGSLKNNNSSKGGKSALLYLEYSIDELKEHLEKQFESWMTWNNWGKYDVTTWDDNESLTWTWQIDHIIPQSMLIYTSMEDENFKKCWSLSNLRPLSAKQNIIDGASKIRQRLKN